MKKKKKQSPSRNADTEFMNKLWRDNAQARAERSHGIRQRELEARERVKRELANV